MVKEKKMADYCRKVIADGVGCSTVIDPKFKTNTIKVSFITRLEEETAAANALAIGVMGSSNSKYKNLSEITAKLNSLYGASINVGIAKQGDMQKLSIAISAVDNRYALEKEDISGEVLDILMDCLFSPYAPNEEFGKEPFDFRKKDLLDSIDAEINNKRGYAILRTQKKAFVGESCAYSPYGTKETASAVTAKEAFEAYKRLLKNAQVEIYYVGAQEAPKVEERLSRSFKALDRQPVVNEFISFSPVKDEVCRWEEKLDVTQCKMVMAFKSDYKDRYSMTFLNTIFGATPFSKLFMNVREKLSLCYYCASNYSNLKGTMMVDSGVEEENIEKAENEILAQLESIKRGEFTDEEMHNSLLSILNSLKGVGDTPYSYINWYYGCYINNEMIRPEEAAERYSNVTREQIIEAAKSLKLDTVYVMKGEG